MPIKAAQWNPANPSSGAINATATTFNIGQTGNVRFVFWNASPSDILIGWGAGSAQQDIIPAWQARLFCITVGQSNLTWQIDSTLDTSATPPASLIKVVTYQQSEPITDSFPIPIQHQVSLGSGVNVISANNVSNTNLPAGSVIVFGLPVNDTHPAGTTLIYNDGAIILGDASYTGQVNLITNGGDSFLLEANGWTQTDSAGANVSTLSDTGIFSVGSANHNGAVQITGTGLVSLIMNLTAGILIADSTGTTATQLNTSGVIAAGNANAAGELKLQTTGGFYDLDMQPVAGTINGSGGGSLTYWQIFKGSGLKIVLVSYSSFKNSGASNQPITFPTAFTTFQCILTSNIPTGVQLWNGGAVTNVGQMIFSTSGGTGGTESSQATLVQNEVASHLGAANQLQHLSGQAVAWSGWAIIIGI